MKFQIMVRVKDAELQKLRSQTKNLQNSLDRSSEVSYFYCLNGLFKMLHHFGECDTQFEVFKLFIYPIMARISLLVCPIT